MMWEYETDHDFDLDGADKALQEHGDDGWELAAVVPTEGRFVAIFKRHRMVD